ncbi:hypothetical protein TNCV_1284141 [Trichonephila clavipes]|uniref:Uncharacterized protein n=1 Tax=Trichonephila clavipes TaxID=2585209 RepID=A0A8X6VK41_TRICX|nr:hypothetical protein TNCV_1284141 [Trichonephila clavipes]
MGSFHHRFNTELEEFAGPNTDSADFAVFLVRFAEGTSLGHPPKRQVSLFLPLSDPLTSLIYPPMFFPCPPLSDSAPLNFCHSSAPIRFDTFQLSPTGADVWVIIVCFQTRCRHRIGSKQNTLLMHLL